MNKNLIKAIIAFTVCVIITFVCAWLSTKFQGIIIMKEVSLSTTIMLLSYLAAAISMFPLFLIIVKFSFFSDLELPLKTKPRQLPASDSIKAIITMIAIAGITFPFLVRLGKTNQFFRGHGFIIWIGLITTISFILLRIWYNKASKNAGWKLSDLGLEEKTIRPAFCAFITAIILTLTVTILIFISMFIYQPGIQTIKSFFKPFHTLTLLETLVYFLVFAAFFSINAGAILYGWLRLPEKEINGNKSDFYTQLAWWGYSVIIMLGGFLFIILIDYFIKSMLLSSLIKVVPLFAIFFFVSTWFYRKSGTIYTGSFVLAIIAAWLLPRGSVF